MYKNILIDVQFAPRSTHKWSETKKRSEHVFDRMQSRGIGIEQIKEAVTKGAKKLWPDGRITAEFRWYRVIYREFIFKKTRKIYPITVEVIK